MESKSHESHESLESHSHQIKILGASYGLADVTDHLAKLVHKQTSVTIRAVNEVFGDPWPGNKKTLTIVYRFGDGHIKTVIIPENESVKISHPAFPKTYESVLPTIKKEPMKIPFKEITAAGKHVFGIRNTNANYDLSGGEPREILRPGTPTFLTLVVGESGQLVGLDTIWRITRYQGEMADAWEIIEGLPDKPTQLSVGPDDSLWAVTEKEEIFRFKGGKDWEKIEGNLKQISVGPPEHGIWGTNSKNEIFRLEGGKWEHVPGFLQSVSVGLGGVWGVNPENAVFHYLGEGHWEKVDADLKLNKLAVTKNEVYGCELSGSKAWKLTF